MTRRANEGAEPSFQPPAGSTSEPQIRDLIRTADTDRSVEERVLAMRLVVELHTSGRCNLLVPLLTDEIRRLRRRHTLRVERGVKLASDAPAADGGWLQLLEEGFATVDGRFVTWGEATVEDHESRLEWLRGQVAALNEDVDRHEQAIKLIREHGVTCLAEVEAAA
jgi:hypothetical protein